MTATTYMSHCCASAAKHVGRGLVGQGLLLQPVFIVLTASTHNCKAFGTSSVALSLEHDCTIPSGSARSPCSSQSQNVYLNSERHSYSGNSETSGDSKNAFLHCGDVLVLDETLLWT